MLLLEFWEIDMALMEAIKRAVRKHKGLPSQSAPAKGFLGLAQRAKAAHQQSTSSGGTSGQQATPGGDTLGKTVSSSKFLGKRSRKRKGLLTGIVSAASAGKKSLLGG